MEKRCDLEYICPFEYALDIISGKWKGLVIYYLHINGVMRYSEIRRSIPAITQKMLTQTLRYLEKENILERKVYPVVPPKVEYKLTKKGETVVPILEKLQEWGKENMNQD